MAKGRKIRHYSSSYMGRKRKRHKIIKAIAFMILLAALIFVGYSAAQSISRLNDPNYKPSESEPSSSESPVPSSDSSAESSSSESEDNSSDPEPANEALDIRSIVLPQGSMGNLDAVEAFLKTVDKSLYNSVTVELKNREGQLLYPSEAPLAATSKALSETQVDPVALAQLIERYGFRPVARIYALQDDYASHARFDTSYLYENQSITWLDNSPNAGGKSWLNPYMEKTGEYLNTIVEEIAKAGYKAIIVNGIQYPSTANQRGMGLGPNRGTMTTKEALESVYNGMALAVEEYDIPLIPAYRGDCYKGDNPQIYTVNPNEFAVTPVSPIVGGDLSLLDAVSAPAEELIPTVDSADQIAALKQRGIEQYQVG